MPSDDLASCAHPKREPGGTPAVGRMLVSSSAGDLTPRLPLGSAPRRTKDWEALCSSERRRRDQDAVCGAVLRRAHPPGIGSSWLGIAERASADDAQGRTSYGAIWNTG
jgi:hypothetical protein